MAIQTLYEADFDDSNVTMKITFDDVSQVVQQLQYHNATARPGALVLTGPFNHTYVCPANTTSQMDLTPQNIVLVKTTGTGKFGPFTAWALPGGEQVSFQWPSG